MQRCHAPFRNSETASSECLGVGTMSAVKCSCCMHACMRASKRARGIDTASLSFSASGYIAAQRLCVPLVGGSRWRWLEGGPWAALRWYVTPGGYVRKLAVKLLIANAPRCPAPLAVPALSAVARPSGCIGPCRSPEIGLGIKHRNVSSRPSVQSLHTRPTSFSGQAWGDLLVHVQVSQSGRATVMLTRRSNIRNSLHLITMSTSCATARVKQGCAPSQRSTPGAGADLAQYTVPHGLLKHECEQVMHVCASGQLHP